MAYIVDYAVTFGSAGALTNTAVNMPQHQSGDLLVALVTMNAGAASAGAASVPASGNWVVGSDATNTANTFTWLRALATASNNVLALTTADDYCCTVISIRDHGGTTATNAVNLSNIVGTTTATVNPVNTAITPTVNDTLVLYMVSVAGAATMAHSPPGIHHVISYDNGGGNDASFVQQSVGWYVHRTGNTATPAPTWSSNVSGAYARATIAITNAAAGRIPAYIGDSPSPASTILTGHITGSVAGTLFNYTGSLTMTGAMTNGKTTSFVANSTTAGDVADLGINPFSAVATKAPATQAATALTGFEITFRNAANNANLARDFSTGGLIVGSVIGGTPKMGAFGIGSITEGGAVVRVGSAAGAWRAYQVAAKDAVPNTVTRSVFAIEPGFATTQYGSAGTWATNSTVHMQFLSNQPSFASTVCWSEIYYAVVHTVCGGTTTNPVDADGLADVGKSYRLPVIQKFGGNGILSYVPLRIGGEDRVNFRIDAGAMQFPRRYNTTAKEIAYHGSDGELGIEYAGVSGDVIQHSNSVITSPTPYYWRIAATATNAATWNFTGTTVVNAIVTLRNVTTFNEMSFTDCISMDASGTTVTNSNISLDSTTNNPLVVTSTSSFSNCDFNTTGITAGIGMVSLNLTTAVPFSNCTFTGSGTTGHAIIITQPGTYAFINMTFTGYGGTPGDNLDDDSGSTSAAVYNNSGGVVIIQVSGGNQPSVRNSLNSTTDVQSSAQVIISGLVADSEVRAYTGTDPATAVEIAGTDSSTGTSFTFTQSSSGVAGYIQIFHVEYQPIFLSYTYLGTNDTITVQQIKDRQYARGTTFTPT